MPTSITITTESLITSLGDAELDQNTEGEDVKIFGGQMFETDYGDLAVTVGVETTAQSIERELPANPGTFTRRPEWGGGLNGMVFKGATISNRDRIQTRSLARLHANQRVLKIDEVSTTVEDDGLTLTVRVESLSGRVEDSILIKPPGVS